MQGLHAEIGGAMLEEDATLIVSPELPDRGERLAHVGVDDRCDTVSAQVALHEQALRLAGSPGEQPTRQPCPVAVSPDRVARAIHFRQPQVLRTYDGKTCCAYEADGVGKRYASVSPGRAPSRQGSVVDPAFDGRLADPDGPSKPAGRKDNRRAIWPILSVCGH